MMKIDSADLITQARGMYKSNRVFDFIESLDVDSDTAWKILDFLKDYSDMFVLSKKEDREYYQEEIDHEELHLISIDDAYNKIVTVGAGHAE